MKCTRTFQMCRAIPSAHAYSLLLLLLAGSGVSGVWPEVDGDTVWEFQGTVHGSQAVV